MLVPVEVVGTGGGVEIFLKHEIKFKRRYDLENPLKSLWIEICFKNSKSVLIGCYYRPPEGTKYLINNFRRTINQCSKNQLSLAISTLRL